MAHSVNLFDVLSLINAASQNSWFVLLLLAALLVFGWIAAVAFRRLRREQQALKAIRARALPDERDIHPPNRLERVLRDAMHADVHDVFEEDGDRD